MKNYLSRFTPLQYAAAAAALVIVFALVFRRRGGGLAAPSNPEGLRPGFSPEGEAQRFANAFNGWDFFSSERREMLNDLWRMSDDELGAVYNAYAQANPGRNMKSVIQSDWIFGSEVDRVINRLNALGL